jgi:hypothetical protein
MRAEAGYCPRTTPVPARIRSLSGCSAAAWVGKVPRKRSGSAIRQVARLDDDVLFVDGQIF